MAGVTSSYPAALDSESNLTPPNNGDTLSVADHWLAGNSGPIVAIETELGTDPAGSFTDVKSRLDSGLVEEADQWVLTSDYSHSGNSNDVLTANWSRWSNDNFTQKGTGMTESSGVFSFPSTGFYDIDYNIMMRAGASDAYFGGQIQVTTNNSTYNGSGYALMGNAGTNYYVSNRISILFKVADISNCKVRFSAFAASSCTVQGTSGDLRTSVRFKKLGGL